MKLDPTARELRVFGVLWLLFFPGVAAVAAWRPQALIGAAVFLALAWIVSLCIGPESRREQGTGFLMPVLLAGAGSATLAGCRWTWLFAAAALLASGGAAAIWASPRLARGLFVQWMRAVAPAGWTITQVVLAVVFYAVVTPVGIVMRLAGHDPMHRRFDRDAESYWVERPAPRDAASYFRQF